VKLLSSVLNLSLTTSNAECIYWGQKCINSNVFAVAEKFLLFARKQEIRGVHLDRPYFSIIPAMTVPNVHNPVALDYILDAGSTRNIYWTDDSTDVGQLGLHSTNLGGTSFELLDSGMKHFRTTLWTSLEA